jgi:hypothetical protein
MIRAVMEIEIILLVRTLVNKEVKLITLPLCILPLIRDTISHINARLKKNGRCDGTYPLRLAGLVATTARNDIVSITISNKRVMILNLRRSIKSDSAVV